MNIPLQLVSPQGRALTPPRAPPRALQMGTASALGVPPSSKQDLSGSLVSPSLGDPLEPCWLRSRSSGSISPPQTLLPLDLWGSPLDPSVLLRNITLNPFPLPPFSPLDTRVGESCHHSGPPPCTPFPDSPQSSQSWMWGGESQHPIHWGGMGMDAWVGSPSSPSGVGGLPRRGGVSSRALPLLAELSRSDLR